MARAAMGAGVLAAPNSSLAGGPVGLRAFFGTAFLTAARASVVAAKPPSSALSATDAAPSRASAQQRPMRRILPPRSTALLSSAGAIALEYRHRACAGQEFFAAQPQPR